MKTLKDTQTKLTQNNEKLNSLLQEMDTKQVRTFDVSHDKF